MPEIQKGASLPHGKIDFRMDDINLRIEELTQLIAELPVGYISKKTIHGKVRCYLQWSENGQKKSKYVDDATAEALTVQIDQRRALQQELKMLKSALKEQDGKSSKNEAIRDEMTQVDDVSEKQMEMQIHSPKENTSDEKTEESPASESNRFMTRKDLGAKEFHSESHVVTPGLQDMQLPILFGNTLQEFASVASGLKHRPCISRIQQYLISPAQEKICVIYGLLHSGKTTLIRQIIQKMNASGFERSALIPIHKGDSITQLFHDIRMLQEHGYKYIFIDNVTLLSDFIQGSAMFADTFAASGLKIVMTGDESFSFMLSAEDPLYTQCEWIHTTPLSFIECEKMFGSSGETSGDSFKIELDDYLVTGGILSTEKALEFVDAAVVRNLSVAIENMGKDSFTSLQELKTLTNLKNVVYAALDDLNDRFLMDAFKRSLAYQSRGFLFGSSGSNYFGKSDLALESGKRPEMSHLNLPLITERLKDRLGAVVRARRAESRISEAILNEVFDYLNLVDMTCEVPVQFLPVRSASYSQILLTIPSIRYEMISYRVKGLLSDLQFRNFNSAERQYIYGRIMSAVKDQILRDHVIIETVHSSHSQGKDIFRLQFPNCEIDMILCDPEKNTCEMYLISNSSEKNAEQSRLFTNRQRCEAVAQRYGTITKKVILYRGPMEYSETEGIIYQNVEEYLSSLSDE